MEVLKCNNVSLNVSIRTELINNVKLSYFRVSRYVDETRNRGTINTINSWGICTEQIITVRCYGLDVAVRMRYTERKK